MQASEIALSKNTSARLRMRAIINQVTREARGGQEKYWQEKLTELDRELELRWNVMHHHWAVYYDHHGLISCIASFKRPGDFGRIYKNLRYNAWLDSRSLAKLYEEQEAQFDAEQNKAVNECAEEFAEELHHATRGRVINDGVKDNDY